MDLDKEIILKSIDITKYFIYLVLTDREVRLPSFLKVTDYGAVLNFTNLDELIFFSSMKLAEKLSNVDIIIKISKYEDNIDYLIFELFSCFPVRIINKSTDRIVLLILEKIRDVIGR